MSREGNTASYDATRKTATIQTTGTAVIEVVTQ
jgi:hypothetical protein